MKRDVRSSSASPVRGSSSLLYLDRSRNVAVVLSDMSGTEQPRGTYRNHVTTEMG